MIIARVGGRMIVANAITNFFPAQDPALVPPPPPEPQPPPTVLVARDKRINLDRLEIVVVGHTRHAMLQATLNMWAETTSGYRAMYVIANHPTTLDGIVLPDRTTPVQTGRPPCHAGCLSESWNLGLMWTFVQHPETEWVVLSQDDVKVRSGWVDLVNAHDADFYNAPAGDMIMLMNRHAFRKVGWFDEQLRTIGGQDLDWISRATLILGPDRIVSEDHHGWRYNPIGLEAFWESAAGGGNPGASYMRDGKIDVVLKEHLRVKWGITSQQLHDALIAHTVPQPVQEEYDWYPWYDRKDPV